MPHSNAPPLSYRDAGVDINAGDELVRRIRPHALRTRRDGVLSGLGGFGGLFELPSGYTRPVLVAGTDGVGTKLKLAIAAGRHRAVGVDLVAMCVNDVLVCGAEPLFFLDYYASARLDPDVAAEVVAGIADGCEAAGAALLGGETAEMPDMYAAGDYDLAGFCVGVVEKDRLLDGSTVRDGDALLALASSGPHANGFSLIRRVLERSALTLDDPLPGDERGRTLADALLAPTEIYVKPLRPLLERGLIRALAHITGGGLTDNLPRVLPDALAASIDPGSWQRPALFDWLQRVGNIDDAELWRTFNCGVGMVVVVADNAADDALALLAEQGATAWRLGSVAAAAGAENPPRRVRFDG